MLPSASKECREVGTMLHELAFQSSTDTFASLRSIGFLQPVFIAHKCSNVR